MVAAWPGLRAVEKAKACAASPCRRVRTVPRAIISTPMARATIRDRKPTRRASRMLGGTSSWWRRVITVAAVITPTIATAPEAAATAATASTAVASAGGVKCDGTRRHACIVMPATSTAHATPKTASSRDRVGTRIGTNDRTQVSVASVSPKDSPKVAGLRQDSGPDHGPPVTSSTPRWNRPLTSSTAATW